MTTMQDTLSQTKAEFLRAKERLARALATTPDERIHWSPSPTARTPLQQVAHCAMSIAGIHGMLVGKPFPYAGIAEFDTALRAAEREFTTREQVLGLLEQTSAEYLTWLEALTPEQFASTVHTPFGQTVPMAVGLGFPAYHTLGHIAQVDYIQTIYGDQDWHI